MKKILLIAFMLTFSFASVFANIEDDSIIKELEKNETKTLDLDFNLKSFESCKNMEDVMGDYIKTYWKNNKDKYYNNPIMFRTLGNIDMMTDDIVMDEAVESESISEKSAGSGNDFSKTNTQVSGVDESDIIKTDGKYIYYFNSKDHFVYISDVENKEIIKKIKVPKNFSSPVLYLGENRLTILSTGYSNYDYSKRGYWINRNAKTYTIVFDTTDIQSPKLTKLYITDGDLRKSRKIGKYLYIISNNSFNIPYYSYKEVDDIKFSLDKVMPKKIDISKTFIKSEQNLELKGKKLPYNVKAGNIAKCSEIEYVLPDEETLKEFDFDPSYNVISIIDTEDTKRDVKTKVIAGSSSEIYMSLDNLYLTTHMYQSYNFSCPINARCFAPWYPRGVNTLIHKMNINNDELSYQTSTIVPGSPLNQYSMDEYKGNFRILTSVSAWDNVENESSTNLYILDKDLEKTGSIERIEPGEEFKSSRYIGDKLYLVTFERTDPLFVIDLADVSKPEILGELKIPGFSTYLHPYDDNHLIGLGYDTTENKWGGITTNGVKLDLYEINYDKKCGDSNLSDDENKKCDSGDYKGIIVKQKYTKTFGERGSSSEALRNPRMFIWKAGENNLFLPAELRVNDKVDTYRTIDYFQGLISINIDKDSGIKENYKITHIDTSNIEEERKKDCSKYTGNEDNKCVKLLNGEEYCENKNRYVPKYCYANSPIGEYLASRSWNFRDSFVKRALWIGDEAFGISNNKISSHKEDGKENYEIKLK